MLQTLSIRDFVIVDTLDLDFKSGFTVLTGETGAGKSILIDALSLVLGARGEGGITRSGAEKAEISATFELKDNAQAMAWLAISEMVGDEPSELILRRIIYADGRSRAYINGIAATMQQLKDLGELLVDIYSQNAHHSLLKLSVQRLILDDFGGLSELAIKVAQQYKQWHELHIKRVALEKHADAYADEMAELRDKTREIAHLNFLPDEWESLQQEHARLSNGASILSGGEACCEILSEGDLSALHLLAQVQHKLQGLLEYDPALNEAVQTLDSAVIQLEETSRFLNRYVQKAELDPGRLNEIDMRIQAIHNTARKYRCKPESLSEMLMACQARMVELENVTDDGALAQKEAQALTEYQKLADMLSAGRQSAAKNLSAKVTLEMQHLSLGGGRFVVDLAPQAPSASGLEQVEFLVAGHIGVEMRALNKVASGGELSRISLAIRVVTAQQGSVPTMIFDEVDVGIGGGVAEVVGRLLKQLAEQAQARQVLVITHLPQVASQGLHHLRVSKNLVDGKTLSKIDALDKQMRIDEISRMLGGLEITETTRQHAKEMLNF